MAKKEDTTIRVPLVGSPNNRGSSGTKDQRFINYFPERIKNELTQQEKFYLQKRFGTQKFVQPEGGGTGVGRGIYYWNSKFWVAIDNALWRVDADGTNATNVQTIAGSPGAVGFTEAKLTNTYLVVSDGAKAWYINTSNVITEITDPQFPTPHWPTPVFMDGYLFVQKTTGEIFNSDAGNIAAWSGSNISPDNYPDLSMGLARQNNQVVAFGQQSVEFFYNAATTGSPIAPNSQAVLQFGCASMTSVAQEEGILAFVAQSQTGGRFVVAVDGFEPHNISNAAIERLLEAEGSQIINCWGYFIRVQGHFFYVLNLPSNSRTCVYDMETKMWHEWDWTDNGTSWAMFPMSDKCESATETFFLHSANGWVYRCRPDFYQDACAQTTPFAGQTLRGHVQTGRFDGDTTVLKFLSRLSLVGDFQASTSDITLYYSDDDYQNWKPSGGRTLKTSTRGYIYRLGSFRRRAFLLVHIANTPSRLEAIEMEIQKGIH